MAGPRPKAVKTSDLKSRILSLAQTSVYQVKIQPPPAVIQFLRSAKGFNYLSEGEDIELLCSRTSLPGSNLFTHTQLNDYHGVTEQMAYRRDYGGGLDMTFYVDLRYKTVDFFEGWVDYIVGQGNNRLYSSNVANYRMSYPNTYRGDVFITKYEKDTENSMSYQFISAFPTSVISTPISYEGSEILKYTVSFSFIRYIRETENTRPFNFSVVGSDLTPNLFSLNNFSSLTGGLF